MVAEILDRINSSVIQSIQQSFKANKRQKVVILIFSLRCGKKGKWPKNTYI